MNISGPLFTFTAIITAASADIGMYATAGTAGVLSFFLLIEVLRR